MVYAQISKHTCAEQAMGLVCTCVLRELALQGSNQISLLLHAALPDPCPCSQTICCCSLYFTAWQALDLQWSLGPAVLNGTFILNSNAHCQSTLSRASLPSWDMS